MDSELSFERTRFNAGSDRCVHDDKRARKCFGRYHRFGRYRLQQIYPRYIQQRVATFHDIMTQAFRDTSLSAICIRAACHSTAYDETGSFSRRGWMESFPHCDTRQNLLAIRDQFLRCNCTCNSDERFRSNFNFHSLQNASRIISVLELASEKLTMRRGKEQTYYATRDRLNFFNGCRKTVIYVQRRDMK